MQVPRNGGENAYMRVLYYNGAAAGRIRRELREIHAGEKNRRKGLKDLTLR